jgi:(1->4)-alpha-D-glucan 1-alpha-D-glucosylmutase
VDFAARAAALTADPPDWSTLAASWPDGRLKMLWIRHLLDMRGKLAETFRLGDYVPLDVRGPHRDHVIAFARRLRRHAAIVVVTRQLAAFTDGGRQWPRLADFNAVVDIADFKVSGHAGPELKLGEALSVLPVAVFNASVR